VKTLRNFGKCLPVDTDGTAVPSWSCSQAASKPVWHTIPLLYVQWKTPDDGQGNYPKHIEFHSKNRFEKLVHLVGFIIRNLTRCAVTWTSDLSWRTYCIVCNRWMSPETCAFSVLVCSPGIYVRDALGLPSLVSVVIQGKCCNRGDVLCIPSVVINYRLYLHYLLAYHLKIPCRQQY